MLLRASAAFALSTAQSGLSAIWPRSRSSPTIGAIRWDAWYDPTSQVTRAVTQALAPHQYHVRLPFFARIDPGGDVFFDGGTQTTIDAEINLASGAGIDYWAFVGYPPSSSMSIALRLYLASSLKHRIQFCMFTDLPSFGAKGQLAPMILYHASLMREPQYMRVAGGRPLYFMGFFKEDLIQSAWGGIEGLRRAIREFRQQTATLGVGEPYIVLSGAPAAAARWADQLGLDAIGAYSIAAATGTHSYRDLAKFAEQRWEDEAATGSPMVPTAMTGWDPRPRIENPLPWEPTQRPGVGMEHHYETARADEIALHISRCLDWVEAHPQAAAASTILVYAWNEHDEGGWLVPTLPFDDSRLQAVRSAVCEWRARRHIAVACGAG
jgi:hypothetical protein